MTAQASWAQTIDNAQRCRDELNVGNLDLALHYCTLAIDSGRLSKAAVASSIIGRGNGYLERKNYDESIKYYDEAIRLNPNDPLGFMQRGRAYSLKRSFDRAIDSFDQVIRLQPALAEAFVLRGTAYMMKKEYDRAIQDLTESTWINLNYIEALLRKGYIYTRLREYGTAIQHYNRAIALDAKNALAYTLRASAYSETEDYDHALQDHSQAISLSPKDPFILANRGTTYRRKGSYDLALADYKAAAKLDDNAVFARVLGFLYFHMGNMTQSAEAMARAVQLSPQDMYVILWRYLAYAKASGLQSASQELAVNTTKIGAVDNWPAPVINFYLGKIDQNAMLKLADEGNPHKKTEQLCEARFYAAEAKLLNGAPEQALPLLRDVEKDCHRGLLETEAASLELRRLARES